MLRDAHITHIYTTDFRRTRSTAAPAAAAASVVPTVYTPNQLAGLADGCDAARHRGEEGQLLRTVPALRLGPGDARSWVGPARDCTRAGRPRSRLAVSVLVARKRQQNACKCFEKLRLREGRERYRA